MPLFSNESKYQSSAGEIKLSQAIGKFHFKGKTKGISLKYVAEGHETYLINKETIEVQQGQFILLRQEEIYEAISPSNIPKVNGVCIDLSPTLLDFDWDEIYKNPLLFNIPFDCAQSTALGHGFRNFYFSKKTKAQLSEGQLILENFKNTLLSFSKEVSLLRFPLQSQAKKINTQRILMSKLIAGKDFIYKNFTKKITLDQLAKHTKLSKFQFSRLFKKCFEQSPFELQEQLRMQKARDLILNSQLSFTEIAYQLGYYDLATFSNQFKKNHGVAPSKIIRIE